MIDRVADQVVALSVGNLADLRSAAKSLRTIDIAPQLKYAGWA